MVQSIRRSNRMAIALTTLEELARFPEYVQEEEEAEEELLLGTSIHVIYRKKPIFKKTLLTHYIQ